MNKKILFSVIAGTAIVLATTAGYVFWYIPSHTCPASCDDGNPCTQNTCSPATGYQCRKTSLDGPQSGCSATATCGGRTCRAGECKTEYIQNCCGNKTCEATENYNACPADCPNCDDNNNCTKDYFDYHGLKCVNAPNLNIVCCGNTACEAGETYASCPRDCPNCDDDNKCTKDSYDYHKFQCLNEIIIPCCGNRTCDKGVEKYSNCPADCPNCDDNNKLTTDSFNYTTQKCENVLTHYFFNDFEAGTEGWDFYNAVDGGPNPDAWTLIREGSNTVLRGVGHNFADISGKGWDNYILKFKFKRIKGSLQVNFRNNFFIPEEPTHRYIIRIEEDGRLVLAKGLNEQKGIYQDLQGSSASFRTGWHTLEARIYQDVINIYLDGNLLIKYRDAQDPFLSGKVNLENDAEFLFDNVEIKIISERDIIYP